MVDFSDSNDMRRWIGAIQPETRRNEVAVALAAREALRVTPLLYQELTTGIGSRAEILSDVVLPSLRATALSWAAAKYPARGNELRAAAYAARAAIHDEAPAAARAAAAAGTALYDNAPDAACAAFEAVDAAAHAYAVAYADVDARTAARSTAALIDSGGSGTELARLPLWPNGAPDWASKAWRSLKSDLLAANEGWEVWIEWYEARLAGDATHPPNEVLEIARATIPDENWELSPAVVNAEIKQLISEYTILEQRPAAFYFRVVDDKVDALPDDGRPIDPESARDFYDETRRKGQILKDRLQRAQADAILRAHIDLLLTRLGESYSEMRPGLMLSVLRSLESDVRAYDGEESRKELGPALLSNILDLAESVRDLCAIFPRSREIEAEAVSLRVPMERIREIRSAIDSVTEKINASDGATEGAREAINAGAAALVHQRNLADEAKQSAYFLIDFANFTRAGLQQLKAKGRVISDELGGLGADSWRAVRRGAPQGIERGAAQAGNALIVGGVAMLMHVLGSDIAALAATVASYVPFHDMLHRMFQAPRETAAPDSVPADEGGDVQGQVPRAPVPRKPKTRSSQVRTRAQNRTQP